MPETVLATDCVFYFDADEGNSIGICTKEDWNRNRGYLPDEHEAQERVTPLLSAMGFYAVSECSFCYGTGTKKDMKTGIKLLREAGMTRGFLGQTVPN